MPFIFHGRRQRRRLPLPPAPCRLGPLPLRTFHVAVIHSHTLPICTLRSNMIQSHRHQSDPRSVSGKPPFQRVMRNMRVGAGKPPLTSVAITGQSQRDREGADADPAISMFPVTYQENWQHIPTALLATTVPASSPRFKSNHSSQMQMK